jgi:alkanesulfonate monooxygenase SsuD/methylene tetrahydromethanopterin reductase-like flavin-dependent oxidoreductase (luciferase family)
MTTDASRRAASRPRVVDTTTMYFGLDVAQQRMPWSEITDRVRFAESLGFDGVWGFDHFQPMYGEGPGECFEAMTTLAAWSGITSSIRLGVLVAGMTYRHPSVFASEAITIDHASNGRLDLSYGAAWFDKEHTELGIPFPALRDRIDAFEEAVQIVRGLLTTDGFTFEGRHYSVRDATLHPRPVQQPAPPLWIGAMGEKRMLGIAARNADVWHAFGTPESLRAKAAILDRHAEAAGRDPASIRRASSLSLEDDDDAVARTIEQWQDAGFDSLICGWPSGGRARIESFARRFLG